LLREPLHHRHVTGILPEWDFCNGLYRRAVFPGVAEIGIEYKSVYPTGHKTYRVVKGVGRQGHRIKVRDSRPSPWKMPATAPRICLDSWPAVSIRSEPATTPDDPRHQPDLMPARRLITPVALAH